MYDPIHRNSIQTNTKGSFTSQTTPRTGAISTEETDTMIRANLLLRGVT
jgi:hypothetical protein